MKLRDWFELVRIQLHREEGQTMAEYGVVLAVIATLVIAVDRNARPSASPASCTASPPSLKYGTDERRGPADRPGAPAREHRFEQQHRRSHEHTPHTASSPATKSARRWPSTP